LVSGGSLVSLVSLEPAIGVPPEAEGAEAAAAEAVGELETEEALGGNDKVSGFMSSVAATALSDLNSGGVAAKDRVCFFRGSLRPF
jgi:hypothetical protein